MGANQARLRRLNAALPHARGEYVLYWMQLYRRLERNHALDYALVCSRELKKPLVVYEGLRLDYPWASRRLHAFVLEGMAANVLDAAKKGFHYWPFVETAPGRGRGLLKKIAARAALVVTDDFPGFVVPDQSEALARQVEVPVFAVDGNGVVPLSRLGPAVSAAAHLRPRLHRAFGESFRHRASARPRPADIKGRRPSPPFEPWRPPKDLAAWAATLPVDASVSAVASTRGGRPAGLARLREFLKRRLRGYAEGRSVPRSLAEGHQSGLSPYLHFGHVSVEEVAEAVLGEGFSESELFLENAGRRENFFSRDADVNAFLDEALVWRDVGFLWHAARRRDAASLDQALPGWALATLRAHARDKRAFAYSLEEWEAAETHDPLWNAAQRELALTGTIHGYLRMLWGKKVLEWSRTPEEAYSTLVQLNNKYGLDGRDPNSWSGILWCFGLFDRPWPERRVYGVVRSMSSESAAKKFDLAPYYAYVASLSEP